MLKWGRDHIASCGPLSGSEFSSESNGHIARGLHPRTHVSNKSNGYLSNIQGQPYEGKHFFDLVIVVCGNFNTCSINLLYGS